MNKVEKDFHSRITYQIGLFIILILLPFAAFHAYYGQWVIAALIFIIIIGGTIFLLHVRRNGSSDWASFVLSAVYTSGAVFVIQFMGIPGTYWIYPAVISNFYILPSKTALGINLFAILAGTYAISHQPDVAVRLFATLSIMILFGYVFSRQITKQHSELNKLTLLDPLTHVANRRALEEQLPKIKSLRERHGLKASAIMLDIDHFKEINDEYDHQTGDQVLKEVSILINKRLRKSDSFYRFGGDEFLIIAMDAGQQDAEAIAEQIRINLAEIEEGPLKALTISAGVSELGDHESPESWIKRADSALYTAKKLGRNRVSCNSLEVVTT